MIVTMDGNINTTKQHKLMRHFFIFDTFAFACASGVGHCNAYTVHLLQSGGCAQHSNSSDGASIKNARMEMVYVAGDMVECQEATVVD